MNTVKYAITEQELQAYLDSKARFLRELNKYDLSHEYPELERIKRAQFLIANEESKDDN